jgi:HAD superfamily hydrolase (TIGR01509 family)
MKLPRQPAAVIFDMDGLLFDTERLYGQAILTAAAEVGCPMSHDIFLRLIGGSREGNHAFLISHYGPDYPLATLIATWGRHFRELAAAGLPLKPGAIELLDLLDDLGLPRGIATSSTHATVQANLLVHSLTDKPAPDPYLKAAERLGVAPALCLALEDSHSGVRSASAAGMMAIMVPDLIPATDEIQGLCAHVVVDLHDVCRMLGVQR